MSRNQLVIVVTIIFFFLISSCKNQQNIPIVEKHDTIQMNSQRTLAPITIYKTKANYDKYIPVMLSNDKKDIVSFPDVKDVYFKGKLAYPTPLAKGYLLDNRGIGKNVAFLKYTYEEYSKLAETPTKEIMMSMLLETNPLTELYNCNKISSNDIEEINKFIEKGLPGICIDLTK